ncbi:MAG: type II secretion system F family protein [Candidatus Velthaea sp.]
MDAVVFTYTARTVEGEVVRGSMSAPSVESVLATLRTRALFVTAVNRETVAGRTLLRTFKIGGVSRRALLGFFRSFSTLIRAGVAIQRALTVTIERCGDTRLREALRGVLADVEHGCSLSIAMARRPGIFPALYVAMIRAGETGGILDDVLERLALFLERDANLRKSVQSALAYPAVVLTAAIGLVIFLIARIIPMFSTMFESFHVDLPWSTKLLLDMGDALQSPLAWSVTLGSATACALGSRIFVRTEFGRLAADRFRLNLPIVGAIVRKSIMARISRMLATLLQAGIELVTAIDVIIPVAGSPLYARAFTTVNAALREGESLSEPLTAAALFDPIFLALVRVGEETGLIDEMLFKIAAYFETDVEAAIATLGAVIEPLLIICLGTIVGFIVFSVFIPLYSLIGSVSK